MLKIIVSLKVKSLLFVLFTVFLIKSGNMYASEYDATSPSSVVLAMCAANEASEIYTYIEKGNLLADDFVPLSDCRIYSIKK